MRNGPKHSADVDLLGGSDIDEDPFFDDPIGGSSGGLKVYGRYVNQFDIYRCVIGCHWSGGNCTRVTVCVKFA